MKEDLKKKAEELEETLQAQFNLIKSDSQDWLKIGSGILVGGLVAFGLVKLIKGKKENKNKKIMTVLEKEGLLDDEVVAKLNARKQTGFVGRMAAILLSRSRVSRAAIASGIISGCSSRYARIIVSTASRSPALKL